MFDAINDLAIAMTGVVYVALAIAALVSAAACKSIWKTEGWKWGTVATTVIVGLWGYLLLG